ncbi:hypothetical protein PIB30_097062, partial [Stylosanthes scabra]|nr:hypothetical protein [Stylosanthes scabra]
DSTHMRGRQGASQRCENHAHASKHVATTLNICKARHMLRRMCVACKAHASTHVRGFHDVWKNLASHAYACCPAHMRGSAKG